MDNYFIDNSNNIEEIDEQISENITEKFVPQRKALLNDELEIVRTGFSNGTAEGFPLSEEEKGERIDEAEEAMGKLIDP